MSKGNVVNVNYIDSALNDLHDKRDSDENNIKTPFLVNDEEAINIKGRLSESLRYEFDEPLRKHSSSIDPIEAEKWLNPYHNVNIAIFASYLSVGFGLYFIQTPLTFYMVDSLNATPGQQTVINGLIYLPWALKIFCGILVF
jgi:hypothetical protein